MIHPLWYLCIFVRTLLLLGYYKYPDYFKYIILIIGLGFALKDLTGYNNETQIAKVFWHNTRLIHSFLFLLAFSLSNVKKSSIVLMSDIIFSVIYRIYLEITI